MKSKQVIFLAVILGLLVLGVVIKQNQKPAELATEEYSPLDLSFEADRVDRVEIIKPIGEEEQYVDLDEDETGWKVASSWNARADEKKVKDLIAAVQEVKGELRGRDESLFDDFQISDDEAYQIIFRDLKGEPFVDIKLGTKKPDYKSIFIRKSGETNTYLTDANLFNLIGIFGKPDVEDLKSDYWPDTRLAVYEVNKVSSIKVFKYQEGQEVLSASLVGKTKMDKPDERAWSYAAEGVPFEINQSRIQSYLNGIMNWRAQTVLDPGGEGYGFENPNLKVVLGLDDGSEISITAGAADEASKAYFIKVEGEPAIFRLTHFYYENLGVDHSYFFKDNPLNIDNTKVARLKVVSKKVKKEVQPKEGTWKSLDDYMNQIRNFRVDKLLFDPSQYRNVKTPGRHHVEIEYDDGKVMHVDFAEGPISESDDRYAAKLRDGSQPFAVRASTFKKLFEDLDRLDKSEA